jgi:hypothetical protein
MNVETQWRVLARSSNRSDKVHLTNSALTRHAAESTKIPTDTRRHLNLSLATEGGRGKSPPGGPGARVYCMRACNSAWQKPVFAAVRPEQGVVKKGDGEGLGEVAPIR